MDECNEPVTDLKSPDRKQGTSGTPRWSADGASSNTLSDKLSVGSVQLFRAIKRNAKRHRSSLLKKDDNNNNHNKQYAVEFPKRMWFITVGIFLISPWLIFFFWKEMHPVTRVRAQGRNQTQRLRKDSFETWMKNNVPDEIDGDLDPSDPKHLAPSESSSGNGEHRVSISTNSSKAMSGILDKTESVALPQNSSATSEQQKGLGKKDLVVDVAPKVHLKNSEAVSFSSSIESVENGKNEDAQEIIDKITLSELSRSEQTDDKAEAVDVSDFSETITGKEKMLLDTGND